MRYRPGDWYVICDICGFKRYRSECRKTRDGLIVCADTCYDEPVQSGSYRKDPREGARVPDARPEGDPVYVDPSESVEL